MGKGTASPIDIRAYLFMTPAPLKSCQLLFDIRFNLFSDTNRFLKIALAAFVLGYAVQIGAPLRIDTDSMYYLSVAASFADGHGLNFYGDPSGLPVGYSIISGFLDRAGLATPVGLTAVNLIFLLITIAALHSILSSEHQGNTSTIILLFLGSFVVVKHFPLPRPEMAALAASFCALWWFGRAPKMRGRQYAIFLVVGLALTITAITMRSVSVALLPAFVIKRKIRFTAVNPTGVASPARSRNPEIIE